MKSVLSIGLLLFSIVSLASDRAEQGIPLECSDSAFSVGFDAKQFITEQRNYLNSIVCATIKGRSFECDLDREICFNSTTLAVYIAYRETLRQQLDESRETGQLLNGQQLSREERIKMQLMVDHLKSYRVYGK